MKHAEFVLVAIVLIAVVAVALWGNAQLFGWAPVSSPSGSNKAACTLEAKQCPDGTYVGRTGPNCEFAACPSEPSTSTWQTYSSSNFNFTFQYPPDWQSSHDVLSTVNPHIFFGNPLNGTTTYILKIFVLDNPKNLAPDAFVANMIAFDEEQDASASAEGPAPRMTPKFSKQNPLTIAGYPAYELYNVFAFDENDEQIYVQDGRHMLQFVFPMPDANPNLANPAANNAAAREIINTLAIPADTL